VLLLKELNSFPIGRHSNWFTKSKKTETMFKIETQPALRRQAWWSSSNSGFKQVSARRSSASFAVDCAKKRSRWFCALLRDGSLLNQPTVEHNRRFPQSDDPQIERGTCQAEGITDHRSPHVEMTGRVSSAVSSGLRTSPASMTRTVHRLHASHYRKPLHPDLEDRRQWISKRSFMLPSTVMVLALPRG